MYFDDGFSALLEPNTQHKQLKELQHLNNINEQQFLKMTDLQRQIDELKPKHKSWFNRNWHILLSISISFLSLVVAVLSYLK